jgi:hypothetical protein
MKDMIDEWLMVCLGVIFHRSEMGDWLLIGLICSPFWMPVQPRWGMLAFPLFLSLGGIRLISVGVGMQQERDTCASENESVREKVKFVFKSGSGVE